MQKFELLRDEKCVTWIRYPVTVEANTLEEAVAKLANTVDENGYSWDQHNDISVEAAQILWDTVTLLEPEEGEEYGTIEILTNEPNTYQESLYSNQIVKNG